MTPPILEGALIVRAAEIREDREWTDERQSIADMINGSGNQSAGCSKHQLEQAPGPRGGGIFGLDVERYATARAGLIKLGAAS